MLPAHSLDGLLSAFNKSNTLFALGTPDGRVRTFDTVTGRLRSSLSGVVGVIAGKNNPNGPNGHLAEGHTCMAWLDSQGSGSVGQARSWVAIGTSTGAVKVYDSATGDAKWQSTNFIEGGVGCLAYTPSRSSSLLCSGRDGQICTLDAATGKQQGKFKGSKHAVRAAALTADGSKLIVGGSTLSLFDMEKQQRISKFTGHPLPVCALTFAPTGSFALSAAEGERLVAVWATPSKQSSKKKSGPVAAASLAVQQPVVGLATADAPSEGPGCFYAAAVTNAGEAYVWLIRPQGAKAVASQQVAHVCVGSKESRSKQECILAAALEPNSEGVTLLLVAGSPAKPRFERLPISSSGSSSEVTFLQPAAADGLIRSGAAATAASPVAAAAAQQRGSTDVEMLGADNAGEAVQQRVSSKSSRKRQEPEPDAAALAHDTDAAAAEAVLQEVDDADIDTEEPTLGQRVANLEQQQQAPAAAAASVQQQQQQPTAALPPGPVKADSLSVLLTQALRSSDRALLEQCLGVANERVIANSVKRLVPIDAAALLKAAVERLQSKPARGQQMAAWIHAVLLHHTAYLMAAPGAADVLSSLYQIIEGRLAMQRQLLSLAGRLELLLAQSGGQQGDSAEAEAGAAGPQVVYQESDSEAEVEVVDAAADFEESEGDYYTDEDGEEEDGLEEGESEAETDVE